MTRAEALAEARRRWGPYARVRRDRKGYRVIAPVKIIGGPLGAAEYAECAASPVSWEAAFADADKRGGAR